MNDVNDTRPAAPSHDDDGQALPAGREAIPEIARIVRAIDTCMFATRDEHGVLQARPMSNNAEVEWDGTSWFFAPAAGRLVAEVRRDPAALTTYRAEDRFAWVAISGEAEIIDDDDAKRRLWLADLERWFPEGPEDPGVALIRFESVAARWWTDQGDGQADLRTAPRASVSA